MYKIQLAVGHEELENFIKSHKGLIEKNLNQQVEFVGTAVYREGVLQGVQDTRPDLLLLRESLQGKIAISELIYNIKLASSKTRIVFITSDRTPGDSFLTALVNMGVYDLVIGNKVNAKEMLKKIIYPNKFADVAHLVPKVNIDETTNRVSFEAPTQPVQPQVQTQVVEQQPQMSPGQVSDYNKYTNEPLNQQYPQTPQYTQMPQQPIQPQKTSFDNDFEQATMVKPASVEPIKSVSVKTKQVTNNKPKKKGGLFGKKKQKEEEPFQQQIITFVGAGNGVGNSHIAFNTAINLADQNLHVLYIDLNSRTSSIEAIYQLGYEDLGLDTALVAVENDNFDGVERAIGSTQKLLQVTDKRDFLYKTYKDLPSKLHFMFFSQLCINGETDIREDLPKFKKLMQVLLREFKYDIIVLDTPSNFKNPLTQMAVAYAEKVYFTVTQDNAVINSLIKGTRVLEDKNIQYKNKSQFIINKFEKCEFSEKKVFALIKSNLEYDQFVINTLPQINRDFVSASYDAMPVSFVTKNKEFINGIGSFTKHITN